MRKLLLTIFLTFTLSPLSAFASPTSVALRDAYRWWHAKPCSVLVGFAHGLPTGRAGIWEPPACVIRLNADRWSSYMRAELHRPYSANDGYREEIWQVFCAEIIDDVGVMLNRQPPVNQAPLYAVCGVTP